MKIATFFSRNILWVRQKVLPLHSLSLKTGRGRSSLKDLHETVVVREAIDSFS